MYRMGKKSVNDETSRQQDCIAERAKYWLWVLGVLVVGMVVYAIIASCGQVTDYSSVAQSIAMAFLMFRENVICGDA